MNKECKHKLVKLYYRDIINKKQRWNNLDDKLYCPKCKQFINLNLMELIK